ncbi:MAG: XRE family transcriptional regulator [Pseudomonadota bacterium]
MTALVIDSEKLKTIRKARKLGRGRLAKLSGLTERQIARLEGSVPLVGSGGAQAIERLSAALGVPPGALSGDLPLIDDDLEPASKTRCTNGCCD